MSSKGAEVAIVELTVHDVLQQMEENDPIEYAKLNVDPEKKKAVTEAARRVANEQVKLAEEFFRSTSQLDEIAERLSKHLPENRIAMIRTGLEFPTFRMDIIKKDDGNHWVALKREEEALEPARALQSLEDLDWAKIKQYASILVESIAFLMSAIGISLSPGSAATKEAIDQAVEAIQSSSRLQRAMASFIEAWNKAGDSAFGRARAIYNLIKESYGVKIAWAIIKTLCRNMAWYEWLEAGAKVTALIVAALATDGAALIAEMALSVMRAVDFARKIVNVNRLEALRCRM